LSLCGWIDGLQEELENLQKRLAEAEAAEAARKKPKEEKIPKGTLVVEGLVIDEWVSVFCIQLVSLQPTVFSCLPAVHITVYVELHMTFSVLYISQFQPLQNVWVMFMYVYVKQCDFSWNLHHGGSCQGIYSSGVGLCCLDASVYLSSMNIS
jgi:hypothetical protein